MFKRFHAVMSVFCIAGLLSVAGCANNEVVKKDETIAAPTKTPPAVTAPVKVENTKPTQPIATAPAKPIAAQAAKASTSQAALETIYFAFDSSDLGPDARNVLSKDAETLIKIKPTEKVTLEGNCDERGSAEYNLALGERRANAALKYLMTLGVAADRMSVVSYGKEKPAVQGHDEATWAKNRRVEFAEHK